MTVDHCRYRGVDGVLIAAGVHFTKHIQCVLESGYKCLSEPNLRRSFRKKHGYGAYTFFNALFAAIFSV